MSTFVSGIGIWVAVFALVIFLGRKEPTDHGQLVIAQLGLIGGFVLACLTWAVGFLWWLFG